MRRSKIKKLFPALKVLACLSPEDAKYLFPYLSHSLCTAILEMLHNATANAFVPPEIREELIAKLRAHKRKFRYLNDKSELLESNPKRRKQILEKKKNTLASVSECVTEIFSVALPILADYIDCPTRQRKKRPREEDEK
jgi:hypothetical protein